MECHDWVEAKPHALDFTVAARRKRMTNNFLECFNIRVHFIAPLDKLFLLDILCFDFKERPQEPVNDVLSFDCRTVTREKPLGEIRWVLGAIQEHALALFLCKAFWSV